MRWTSFLWIPLLAGWLLTGSLARAESDAKGKWTAQPFLRLTLAAGYDSNPLLLNDDLPNHNALWDVSTRAAADVRLRRALRFPAHAA